MILNQDISSAVVTGEIQNNRVGIDAKNLNFITTLLTSNLYSLPVESFLRETVANAWDSQVEAGNTNTPILIEISDKKNNDITISIRDYGTGLSPDRFNDIYKNIGSSTKRESNDYIGALGIGRFSALAVCDIVNIKSYYQGKCYSYLMYKDGETLNIDLLGTIDTTFDNGVEVQVTIKDAYYERNHIINGLAALTYFEQIYVDCNVSYLINFVDRFNKRTIHEFDTFKVCSISELRGVHILMGNILYEYNDTSYPEFYTEPYIAIKCNIGDIDITPNRESIRYSAKTKELLATNITKVNDEIYSLARAVHNEDFTSVREWHKVISPGVFNLTLWEFEDYVVEVEIDKKQLVKHNIFDNCTIRGKKVPEDLEYYYSSIRSMMLPSNILTYLYDNQQFRKSQSIFLHQLYDKELFLIDEPYKPVTKKYFRENIVPSGRAYLINKSRVKSIYLKCLKQELKYLKTIKGTINKECLRMIREDVFDLFKDITTFNNNDVPKEFIKAQKEQKTQATSTQKRDCIIYTLENSSRKRIENTSEQAITTNSDASLWTILSSTRTVIYAEKGSENLRFMYRVFRKAGILYKYRFIETAKVNIPVLQSCKKCIHVDKLMFEYSKPLAKIFTNVYIYRTFLGKTLQTTYYLDDYTDIVRSYEKAVDHSFEFSVMDSEAYKDFEELYEFYVSKGWIDTTLADKLANPDIDTLSNFLRDHKITFANDLKKFAIMFFIYKKNLKIGNLNRLTAYKFLKEILL